MNCFWPAALSGNRCSPCCPRAAWRGIAAGGGHELGLSASVAVVIGAHDQIVNALGCGVSQIGTRRM